METPDRKVWTGATGGSLAAIVVWLMDAYLFAGAIPEEVYAAFVVAVTFLVSYFVPSKEGEGDAQVKLAG